MSEIRKDRKYILQFPEGTTVDEQKMVIGKMEESLKSDDRFTVVDPKVKVYEAEKVIEEVPAKPVETPKEETKTEDKPVEAPKETPVESGVKVETVEVTTPASETPTPKADPLSESGSSANV